MALNLGMTRIYEENNILTLQELPSATKSLKYSIIRCLTFFDFPEEDHSWELEWVDFLQGISGEGVPLSSGGEALETLEWIYRLYRASAEGRAVKRDEAPTI